MGESCPPRSGPPVKVSEKVCVSGSPDPLVNKLFHQGGVLEKQVPAAPCVQLLSVWSTLGRAGEGREGSRVRLCLLSRPASAKESIAATRRCLLGVGVVVGGRENSASPVVRAGNHPGLLPVSASFSPCFP